MTLNDATISNGNKHATPLCLFIFSVKHGQNTLHRERGITDASTACLDALPDALLWGLIAGNEYQKTPGEGVGLILCLAIRPSPIQNSVSKTLEAYESFSQTKCHRIPEWSRKRQFPRDTSHTKQPRLRSWVENGSYWLGQAYTKSQSKSLPQSNSKWKGTMTCWNALAASQHLAEPCGFISS